MFMHEAPGPENQTLRCSTHLRFQHFLLPDKSFQKKRPAEKERSALSLPAVLITSLLVLRMDGLVSELDITSSTPSPRYRLSFTPSRPNSTTLL